MTRVVLTLTAMLVIVFLVAPSALVGVADANPIPWNTTPNLDQPTISIQTPQNNSVYPNGIIPINFNVIKPDSWKIHIVIPYVGQLASILQVNLDGANIYYYKNLSVDSNRNFRYTDTTNELTQGLHTLNVTVLSYTYYTGPPYKNTHILSDTKSSDGPIYEYPIIVSKVTYFTTNQDSIPSYTPTLRPTTEPFPVPTQVPELPATLAITFLVMTTLAVIVVFKRKDRFSREEQFW